ncbi:MAG: NAD(P)/FAD-dependent oxidoreductase, partial [Lautropia sp.]|nr:NAD(P)/FAD-dependent oxidoreductase [Lautropia sp.]
GLYCAGLLGQGGKRVLLLDHARRIGEKIRISGGGRCNFTNVNAGDFRRYVTSGDPRFVQHALRAHPPARFIEQVRAARIRYHEKHLGQLFCDDSSQQIIDMLLAGCEAGRVDLRFPVSVQDVQPEANGFRVCVQGLAGAAPAPDHRLAAVASRHPKPAASGRMGAHEMVFSAPSLVVATGGLSIPAIGATDYAWRLADAWGLETVPHRPGLVPLTFTASGWEPFRALSGVSLPVQISVAMAGGCGAGAGAGSTGASDARADGAVSVGRGSGVAAAVAGADGRPAGKRLKTALPPSFEEDLLFTHRGLSGPAALQISSYWQPGQVIVIDLLPMLKSQPDEVLVGLKAGRSPESLGLTEEMLQRLGAQPQRQQLGNVLAALLPSRLGRIWLPAAIPMLPARFAALKGLENAMRLAEVSDSRLRLLMQALKAWPVMPAGTEGYRKAEVSVGGVSTAALDPRTLQARRLPGSYWIGEAVDVTGWLGGYNFQWAWSSAHAAARAILAA